jgi:hypothetical protein
MWNDLLDLEAIAKFWEDAAVIDEVTLEKLFIAAHELCLAYAPVLPEGAPVPERYRLAEILQARDIWSKMESGNRDEYGPDGMRLSVTHLDYQARNLLRPKTSPLKRLR